MNSREEKQHIQSEPSSQGCGSYVSGADNHGSFNMLSHCSTVQQLMHILSDRSFISASLPLSGLSVPLKSPLLQQPPAQSYFYRVVTSDQSRQKKGDFTETVIKFHKELLKLRARCWPRPAVDTTTSLRGSFRSCSAAFNWLHFGFKVETESLILDHCSQDGCKVIKVIRNKELWVFLITTTKQTPSAEDDCVIPSKVPQEPLNGPCGEIVSSIIGGIRTIIKMRA